MISLCKEILIYVNTIVFIAPVSRVQFLPSRSYFLPARLLFKGRKVLFFASTGGIIDSFSDCISGVSEVTKKRITVHSFIFLCMQIKNIIGLSCPSLSFAHTFDLWNYWINLGQIWRGDSLYLEIPQTFQNTTSSHDYKYFCFYWASAQKFEPCFWPPFFVYKIPFFLRLVCKNACCIRPLRHTPPLICSWNRMVLLSASPWYIYSPFFKFFFYRR